MIDNIFGNNNNTGNTSQSYQMAKERVKKMIFRNISVPMAYEASSLQKTESYFDKIPNSAVPMVNEVDGENSVYGAENQSVWNECEEFQALIVQTELKTTIKFMIANNCTQFIVLCDNNEEVVFTLEELCRIAGYEKSDFGVNESNAPQNQIKNKTSFEDTTKTKNGVFRLFSLKQAFCVGIKKDDSICKIDNGIACFETEEQCNEFINIALKTHEFSANKYTIIDVIKTALTYNIPIMFYTYNQKNVAVFSKITIDDIYDALDSIASNMTNDSERKDEEIINILSKQQSAFLMIRGEEKFNYDSEKDFIESVCDQLPLGYNQKNGAYTITVTTNQTLATFMIEQAKSTGRNNMWFVRLKLDAIALIAANTGTIVEFFSENDSCVTYYALSSSMINKIVDKNKLTTFKNKLHEDADVEKKIEKFIDTYCEVGCTEEAINTILKSGGLSILHEINNGIFNHQFIKYHDSFLSIASSDSEYTMSLVDKFYDKKEQHHLSTIKIKSQPMIAQLQINKNLNILYFYQGNDGNRKYVFLKQKDVCSVIDKKAKIENEVLQGDILNAKITLATLPNVYISIDINLNCNKSSGEKQYNTFTTPREKMKCLYVSTTKEVIKQTITPIPGQTIGIDIPDEYFSITIEELFSLSKKLGLDVIVNYTGTRGDKETVFTLRDLENVVISKGYYQTLAKQTRALTKEDIKQVLLLNFNYTIAYNDQGKFTPVLMHNGQIEDDTFLICDGKPAAYETMNKLKKYHNSENLYVTHKVSNSIFKLMVKSGKDCVLALKFDQYSPITKKTRLSIQNIQDLIDEICEKDKIDMLTSDVYMFLEEKLRNKIRNNSNFYIEKCEENMTIQIDDIFENITKSEIKVNKSSHNRYLSVFDDIAAFDSYYEKSKGHNKLIEVDANTLISLIKENIMPMAFISHNQRNMLELLPISPTKFEQMINVFGQQQTISSENTTDEIMSLYASISQNANQKQNTNNKYQSLDCLNIDIKYLLNLPSVEYLKDVKVKNYMLEVGVASEPKDKNEINGLIIANSNDKIDGTNKTIGHRYYNWLIITREMYDIIKEEEKRVNNNGKD